MTRINVVPPELLSDKHLMAEYRELPRIFTAVRKLVDNGTWAKFIESNQIPESYVLGEGHCKFFYNKLPWLIGRYTRIRYTLKTERGFTLNKEKSNKIVASARSLFLCICIDMHYGWQPTHEDIYLNMARLAKRSNMEAVLEELKQ